MPATPWAVPTNQPAATPPSPERPRARRKLRPILFLPGIVFWALIATAAATGIEALYIAAAVMFALVMLFGLIMKIGRSEVERAEKRRVWQEGRPATARVLFLGSKGGGVNDHPMVDLVLEIQDDPPRRVSTSTLISQLAIPRVQPGCDIAVRIDLQDPAHLVVDEALTPYGYR